MYKINLFPKYFHIQLSIKIQKAPTPPPLHPTPPVLSSVLLLENHSLALPDPFSST